MKWFKYPLAIVAYGLLGVFLFAELWHYVGKSEVESFWYYFPSFAGVFLLASFILSKLKLPWEGDVMVQVAMVLAPVLWFVNNAPPAKQPVYVFYVKPDFQGTLQVHFDHSDNAETKVRSTADTLFFRFDENGEIMLNEDFRTVRESVMQRLYYLNEDKSRVHITGLDAKKTPSDTALVYVREDSIRSDKGKIDAMFFRVDKSQHLK
ncbi:MAG TPA: hypothetical protein VFU15_07315 [Bacteroidia bacterium]|nr:hypothetical protein [Bacteroidia bacterium]